MSNSDEKGRLTIKENGDANSYALLDGSGKWLLSVIHNGEELTSSQRETMRRVAACWNACDGMSTEVLESITDLGDSIASRFELHNRVEKELMELFESAVIERIEAQSRSLPTNRRHDD